MKKIGLSVLIATLSALFMLNSCKKEYVTEEYYETVYGSQVYTKEYTINPDQWKSGSYADGRNYLFVEFENPKIDDEVMDYGAVMAYVWYTYDFNTGASTWNPLPYVYSYSYGYTNDDGSYSTVGENIRFEYEKGIASFVIEDLDGVTPDPMVDPLSVKIVIITNM